MATPAPVAGTPKPVASEMSVKVELPLLRHRRLVRLFGRRGGGHGEIEIEVAIVIIVNESGGDTAGLATETNFFGDVDELAFALIMEKADAGGFADGKIGFAIVVEIAGRAAEALSQYRRGQLYR